MSASRRLAWSSLALLSLVAGPLGLCACGRDRVGGAPQGTLVFARGKDSPGLDPAKETDGESSIVIHNVYDGLVRYVSGSTDVEPALATSWTSSPDRRVFTFEIRPGVRFHDGTPCDAEAIALNFERQRDKGHRWHFVADYEYWSSLFGFVAKVSAPTPATVRFDCSEPAPPFFLDLLGMFVGGIVSPAAFEKGAEFVERHPVGTGPYKFVSWDRGTIVLEANAQWWGGAPALERLTFTVIPEPGTAALALETGQIQGYNNVAPRDAARFEKDARFRVHRAPGMNVCYLSLNNELAPFTDPEVRRAVALAIHKDRLVRGAYEGEAIPAVGLVPPTIDGHATFADRVPDVAAARAILERKKLVGTPIKLSYPDNVRPYMPYPDTVARLLADDLKDAGFSVTLAKEQWAGYLDLVQNGEHQAGLLGWSADVADADNFLYVLLSKENRTRGAASNISFYGSDAFQTRVAAARHTVDAAERSRLYAEAQQIAFDDVALVPLVHTPQVVVTSKAVEGFRIDPVTTPRFATVRLAR